MDLTMASEEVAVKAASTLPIIDIAPWIEGHDHKGRLSTAAAIHAACLEFGFFYLDVTSYISPGEPEELFRLAREFFSLPQEEKDKISLSNQDHARGALSMFLLLLMKGPDTQADRIPKVEGECDYGQS
jgi:isopenicillin N synthase-like dioxygenase